MRSGVIAQKIGMSRVFTDAGAHVPVTVLRLANCQVVAHRTKEKNGYVALQLGSGSRKVKNVSKPERGRFAAVVLAALPRRREPCIGVLLPDAHLRPGVWRDVPG